MELEGLDLVDMSLDDIIRLQRKKAFFRQKYATRGWKRTNFGNLNIQHGAINRSHFLGRGNHVQKFTNRRRQWFSYPNRTGRFANTRMQLNTSYKQRYVARKLKHSKQALLRKQKRERALWNRQMQRYRNPYQMESSEFGNSQHLPQNHNDGMWNSSSSFSKDVYGTGNLTVCIRNANFNTRLQKRQWSRGPLFVRHCLSQNDNIIVDCSGFEPLVNVTGTTLNERFSNQCATTYF